LERMKERGVAVLKCKVSLGTFTGEVFVIIELPEGKVLTGVADTSQVVLGGGQQLRPDTLIDGGVKIVVVEQAKDKLLVDLPRETFSQGNRVLVPREMVRYQEHA